MGHLQDRLFGVPSDYSPYDNMEQRRFKMQRGAGAGLALSSWEPASSNIMTQWPLQCAQQQYDHQQLQQQQAQVGLRDQQLRQQHQPPPAASAYSMPNYMSFGAGPPPVNYGRYGISAPGMIGYEPAKPAYPYSYGQQYGAPARLSQPGMDIGGAPRPYAPTPISPYGGYAATPQGAFPGAGANNGFMPGIPRAPSLPLPPPVDIAGLPRRARVAPPRGDSMINMGGGLTTNNDDALDRFRHQQNGQQPQRLQTMYDLQYNAQLPVAAQQAQQMRPAGLMNPKSVGPF